MSASRKCIVAFAVLTALLGAGCGGSEEEKQQGSVVNESANAKSGFTDWGWPLPYRRVSPESVAWLKEKGWWPLKAAYQSPFSGQNNVNVVMWKEGLMQKRGIEAEWQPFASGPEVIEAFLADQVQVGNGGNFPFTTLIDNSAPAKCVAVVAPNLLHGVLVPKASPLKSLEDLKGSKAVVGIVAGSSAEFYFQAAAEQAGLKPGTDVTLKNMPIPEQQTLPKGIDAVVPWDPAPTFMQTQIKNARLIDSVFPHNFYMGCFYVHEDLIKNAPDVVQALVDAHVEAILLGRFDVDGVAKLLKQDPNLASLPDALLLDQVKKYNNLYKPTFAYPDERFWPAENERIAKFLKAGGRIKQDIDAASWEQAMEPRFMESTFKTLGWKVPRQPPFIPDDWSGKVGTVPYPPYDNPQTLSKPQPWPEPGDLTQEWQFNGETFKP